VYSQYTGEVFTTARAERPRQLELPAGLATPASTQMLHAPSMLLGQAIKPAPDRVRSLEESRVQPVVSK